MAVSVPVGVEQRTRGLRAYALRSGGVFVTAPELRLGCGSYGDALLGVVFQIDGNTGQVQHRRAVMKRFPGNLEALQNATSGRSNINTEGDSLAILGMSGNIIELLDFRRETGAHVVRG